MRHTSIMVLFTFIILTGCKKSAIESSEVIPDSGLYVSAQYSEASLQVFRNVVFSQRPNFRNFQYTSILTKDIEQASNTLLLKMDIAVPPNATANKLQPLIVFIHGGGFVTGDKDDLQLDALSYAKAGYVVASINYRLTQNQSNDSFRLLSRIHALEDAGNAIRYLKANSQRYFIDTNRVLSLGSSAGGGLSLVNAIEADAATSISDFPGYSTKTKGVISTGATLRLNDLQGLMPVYDAGDSPVLMFHANPLDGGTGATWDDAIATQRKINDSGNSCIVFPQPNLSHTVSLALGGTYWPQLKTFIWEKLNLSNIP